MRFSMRCGLLLLWVWSLASCQSTRPSFSFQSAPLAVAPATTLAAPAELSENVALENQKKSAQPVGHSKHAKPVKQLRWSVAATRLVAVATAPRQLLKQVPTARRRWLARPQVPAESGLGTTVLGVLGLIALPVAGLGLILSGGGLGWIIVGGLAALAVLIAWLDPFGR